MMHPILQASVMYKGRKVYVKILSVFRGGSGLLANVEAVEGHPFHSSDAQAQGESSGAWQCNGYRVRFDAICVDLVKFCSTEWFAGISPIPL